MLPDIPEPENPVYSTPHSFVKIPVGIKLKPVIPVEKPVIPDAYPVIPVIKVVSISICAEL